MNNLEDKSLSINYKYAMYEQTYNRDLWVHAINKYFILLQIPKTGSTTLIHELTKLKLTKNLPCYHHEGINMIVQFEKNINVPIFAIVRNPFHQVFSYFFHKVKMKEIKLNDTNVKEEFKKWVMTTDLLRENHVNQLKHVECRISKQKVIILKFEHGIDKIIKYLNQRFGLSMRCDTHININKVKEKYGTNIEDFFDKEISEKIKLELYENFIKFDYSLEL